MLTRLAVPALLTWVALAAACAQRHDGSVAPLAVRPGLDAVPASSATAQAEAASEVPSGADGAATTPWVEDVRRGRWSEAAVKLDALSVSERSLPEIRYVRGCVALETGDAKAAVERLDGLEEALPLLASDIARRLAEARLIAGPYDKAAAYFGARATPRSLLSAARAYEKAGEVTLARGLCQRVVGFGRKTRLEEAEARACELRLSSGPDAAVLAAGDARWIAVHAPDSAWGADADAALQRLSPSYPLLGHELLARARVLADAGRTDDALKALDRVADAPPPKTPRLAELRLRGDILYRTRGRALEASRVLDECASVGGSHALEDAFHAARALARADSDDEASRRLAVLARAHPRTHWGDEAEFFVPYLALLHGRWREAAAGFDAYGRAYPKGVEQRSAKHGGAIAHLMNGDHAAASRLLEELAAEDPDPLAAARARELSALAAFKQGDVGRAIAGWTAIVRSQPLSWAGVVARARLVEVGAQPAPWVEPYRSDVAPPSLDVRLPPPVDVLHRLGLDGDAEAALAGRESVVFGGAPAGRGLEALCAAYGLVGRGKRRFQLTTQLPVDMLRAAPGPANRWAWECAYPTPFDGEVSGELAAEAKRSPQPLVDRGLVYAVMRQESDFDPAAVSPAHAVGLMQLLPETARGLARDMGLPYDEARLTQPAVNTALAVRYLGLLGDKFAKYPATIPLVVAAYNAGEEAVLRWLSRLGQMDIDEFVECIPYAETRDYVARVMGNWARYELSAHGERGTPPLKLRLAL